MLPPQEKLAINLYCTGYKGNETLEKKRSVQEIYPHGGYISCTDLLKNRGAPLFFIGRRLIEPTMYRDRSQL